MRHQKKLNRHQKKLDRRIKKKPKISIKKNLSMKISIKKNQHENKHQPSKPKSPAFATTACVPGLKKKRGGAPPQFFFA